MPLSIFAVSLCALCGCVIYAFYADCDPISDGRIKKGDQVIENKIIYFYFLYMCSLNVLQLAIEQLINVSRATVCYMHIQYIVHVKLINNR